jgi:phosphoribosylanthranilate isomerase
VPDPRQVAVKVCGVTRVEDARQAIAAGAAYVGAILTPGFARSVDPATAARFVEGGEATLVSVVVDLGVEESARLARLTGAGVIQLHGDETTNELAALRELGDWRLWKAVRVRQTSDVEFALDRWGSAADGVLLEGFREGRVGGAGATFPWEALEAVRAKVPTDLTLVIAGGLTPDNVAAAVSRLAPSVVDVSSGVEERLGVKDPAKMRAFVSRALIGAATGSPGLREVGSR